MFVEWSRRGDGGKFDETFFYEYPLFYVVYGKMSIGTGFISLADRDGVPITSLVKVG
jgi:hypothetical protein